MLVDIYTEWLLSDESNKDPGVAALYENRYHGDYSLIMADAATFVSAATYEDYKNVFIPSKIKSMQLVGYLEDLRNGYRDGKITADEYKESLKFEKTGDGLRAIIKNNGVAWRSELTAEEREQLNFNYDNCCEFLKYVLFYQIDAIQFYKFKRAEIDKLISDRAQEMFSAVPKVYHNKPINFDLPLDRINAEMWPALCRTNPDGQLTFGYEYITSLGKKNPNVYVTFSIDFENVPDTIKKNLTDYDKRVYSAIGAIYQAGNEITTVNQIYKAMGYYKNEISSERAEKIQNSIDKMAFARITLDNKNERNNKYKYPDATYTGYLLPCERIDVNVNGKFVESALHLFREPPLISFARERKQITTIPIKLLQTPLEKNDINFRLEDYLLEQIAHNKRNDRKTFTITLETLFNRLEITRNKKRKIPDIEKALEYYCSQEHIKSFNIDSDKIKIVLP